MLNALNPLSKLLVCLVWLTATILIFDGRFQVAVIAIVAFALIILNRTSPLLLAALMVPFGLFGFGFLTTSVLFRRESEFALHLASETPFGSQAFSAGIILLLRSISCGMISIFFALTTDSGAFVRALMAYLRLPARIGYSLFAAMQLVPDLMSEIHQIRLARTMRSGRRPRRFPGPIETFTLVIPLLAFAIRRAGRTAIAMEARGLASGQRTITSVPAFRHADLTFILLSLAICGVTGWAVLRWE